MDDAARTFERLRPRLLSIAYRMLGSTAEAEVVVRDAYVRWREAALATLDKPEAWLLTIITRLCLKGQKVGESCLPKPVVIDSPFTSEQMDERTDDVAVAFLTLLERLPSEARTAFLLREMFNVDYHELAQTIGKSEAATRELVRRAKANLRDERPRYVPSRDIHFRLLSGFAEALALVGLGPN